MRAACRFLFLLLALAPAAACADTWRLDPVHTRVLFAVDHAGLSQALGTISGAQGVLEFDPDDWASARVELTLPLAALDLGDADWANAVLDRTFLDAGRYPQAHFVSTHVEAVAGDRATVHGLLTLHGVEREIALDVHVNAVKRHPITRRRSAGFSATARLDRFDFGIDAWPNVVGHTVELRIEAEAILDRGAAVPAAAPVH
jgi:polyisoprenoid-binding protein YceI